MAVEGFYFGENELAVPKNIMFLEVENANKVRISDINPAKSGTKFDKFPWNLNDLLHLHQ
jgi:hypothetical protein